jgi:hypothetical protein
MDLTTMNQRTSDQSPAAMEDPLQSASTVAVVIHGIGDHKPVNILDAAENCIATLWKDKAATARIKLQNLPVPRDVNTFGYGSDKDVEALEIQTEGRRHIVIPMVWSGMRFRSERMAGKAQGPMALWVALPALFQTCANLFCSVRKARGLWSLLVFSGACLFFLLLAAFFVGFFYLQTHVPYWLGAPSYDAWDSAIVLLVSFYLFSVAARYFSFAFDLVGDVAHYIAKPAERQQNINQVATLFQTVASRAPNACIVIAGHSLGSVLVSQTLLRSSPNYMGRGRTLLLTMGSPLKVLSRAFPAHVETPQKIAATFNASGSVLGWVNLWREQDIIGKALHAGGDHFVEESLGVGPHSNYWGDERVWISVSAILEQLSHGRFPALNHVWSPIPLSQSERGRADEIDAKLGLIRQLSYWLVITAILFHMFTLSRFDQQFSAIAHVLILAGWDLAFLPLALTAFLLSRAMPRMSAREALHYRELRLKLAASVIGVTGAYLAIYSGVVIFKNGGL